MVLKAFPTGSRLAAALRGFFTRMRAQIAVWLRQWVKMGLPDTPTPNLEVWTDGMVSTSTPILLPTFIREGNQEARRISMALPGGTLSPKQIFNSIHPGVRQAVEELSLDFCQTTNRTAMTDLGTALARTRTELREGLELGEALPKLSARVGSIFGSPRAIDIARTESARAMMAGRFMAAKDSGVIIGKKWLAKSDACEKFCKPLNGKVVALDEPFAIDPKGGPYAVKMYSPYHPNCTCDVQMVIDPMFLGKKCWSVEQMRKMLQRRW